MDPPDSSPQRIDLTRADDLRDVVHRAVASLVQGDLVALALGNDVILCASPLRDEAARSLLEAAGSIEAGAAARPTLLLRGAGEVRDWVPSLTRVGRRLATRAWPGRVLLVVPDADATGLASRLRGAARDAFLPPRGLGLKVPKLGFLRDILRLVPGPVLSVQFPVGRPAAGGPEGMPFPRCAMVIEAREDLPGEPATEVLLEGDRWSVTRPGVLSEAELSRMTGTIVLFVCTGNTCRSPMAEALCKARLARRLGCEPGALEARGYVVLSAGIAAVSGMPAASNAVAVVKARGGELESHASRKLTLDLVRQADHVFAMTADHLDAILSHVPEVAPKARLLHPAGDDVPDPVGSDLATYLRCAEAIDAYLAHWIGKLDLAG